jgi:hypothetical protein
LYQPAVINQDEKFLAPAEKENFTIVFLKAILWPQS